MDETMSATIRETIEFGAIVVDDTRKAVKHVHFSVHPPTGRVTLVAPTATRPEMARAYAIWRLGWIRQQQAKLTAQAREAPRQFVARESHYLWGRRYLLAIVEREAKPMVTLDHRRITLHVRPGSDRAKRQALLDEWHRSLLHAVVPALIDRWAPKLKGTVAAYFLQRMKTRWGGCNHQAGNIRLNTELVKRPKDLLAYVIVHEVVHLLEPQHSDRFVAIIDAQYPAWRDARAELNALPLGTEVWGE